MARSRPSGSSSTRAGPPPRTSSSSCRRPSTTTAGCGSSVPASRRPGRSGPRADRRAAAAWCWWPPGPNRGEPDGEPGGRGAHQRGRATAAGHERAEQQGHADQRPRVRLALGLVGVEEVGAVERGGELPGQLVDVAQPQPQRLPDERWREVRGVAGQQHPAGPPAVGHLRAEDVLGRPQHLDVRRAERGDQLGEPLDQLGRRLPRPQPELPAVAVVGHRHEGRGAVRIADLVHAGPRRRGERRPRVEHEPPVGRASSRIETPARPRTVLLAPSQPSRYRARTDRSVPPSRARRTASTPSSSWASPMSSTPASNRIRGSPATARRRTASRSGWWNSEPRGQPFGRSSGSRTNSASRAHPPVEQPEPGHRPADRQDVVGHPGGLQDAEHLVVQVHRTRQGIGPRVPLDQLDADPAAREQQRRRQPHRSGADDQHRDLGHALSLPGPFALPAVW